MNNTENLLTEVSKKISEKIRLRKFQLNIPQYDFIKQAGISQPTLNHIQKGEMVNLGSLIKLATALDMEIIIDVKDLDNKKNKKII